MLMLRWLCTVGWLLIASICAWVGYSNYSSVPPDQRLLQSVPFLSAAAIAVVIAWAVHSTLPSIRIVAGLLSALIGIAGLLLVKTVLSSNADDLTRNLAWMLVSIPIITLAALLLGHRVPDKGLADNATRPGSSNRL
jgi:phosphatidylserine synthase